MRPALAAWLEGQYVVQHQWRGSDEWLDQFKDLDLDLAREHFRHAALYSPPSRGSWRLIHRVTAIVETVVE